MTDRPQVAQPLDLRRFEENRRKFPPEELFKYANQHIAWSPDGLQILASADEEDALFRKLEESGINVSQVVLDYVDDPESSSLGLIW